MLTKKDILPVESETCTPTQFTLDLPSPRVMGWPQPAAKHTQTSFPQDGEKIKGKKTGGSS